MSVDKLINYFLFKKILSSFVSREEASLISGGEVRAHDPPSCPQWSVLPALGGGVECSDRAAFGNLHGTIGQLAVLVMTPHYS